MSSAARMSILREWRGRTLTLTVLPPLVSFSERRGVLRVLEKYGQVEFFKPLPGHEAMFVSVFRDERSADKLLDDSPLSYSIEIPKAMKKSYMPDLSAPERLANQEPTALALQPGGGELQTEEGMRFELTAFPSPDYHHGAPDSTLAAAWPVFYDKKHSFITSALKQSMPDSFSNRGFAHWGFHLGRQTEDPVADASKLGRLKLKDWTPSKMANASKSEAPTRDKPAAHSTLLGGGGGGGGEA